MSLAQTIYPPVRRGLEAQTVTVTGAFASDPTAWVVVMRFRLFPTDAWQTVGTVGLPTVTGSAGNYTASWPVTFTLAEVAGLSAGLNEFVAVRTDLSSETVISAGVELVL